MLLGSFLLFFVQPMAGRVLLPWFGGAAGLWTVVMLFFQTALLAGNLYAFALVRWCGVKWQLGIHLVLLVGCCLTLPVLPTPEQQPQSSLQAAGQVLWILSLTVGLPYFALTAGSPLLQHWFALSRPTSSPYRLFALSNAGSLGALLSYPFLFEPHWSLKTQDTWWSSGFALYAVLMALVAWRYVRPASDTSATQPTSTAAIQAPRPAAVFSWLAWSFGGVVVLLAGTNHLCQDVAVVPLLWIGPLSLYLLTFVICFDKPEWYWRRWSASMAACAVVTISILASVNRGEREFAPSLTVNVVLHLAAIFFLCVFCHGELASRRPAPAWLTGYYLTMAAGGCLGGVFVGILAPIVFTDFYEWHGSLVVLFLVAIAMAVGRPAPGPRWRFSAWQRVAALAGLAGLLVVVPVNLQRSGPYRKLSVRNFYGVVRIDEFDEAGDDFHIVNMIHGTTIHGWQFRTPAKRSFPTTYYSAESGIGAAFRALHESRKSIRVGAVGLGAGTIAAYGRAGDSFRFYEINPAVASTLR